jgi:hypothetical protein
MPQSGKVTSWKELLAKSAELGMSAIHLTKESGQKAMNELKLMVLINSLPVW